MIKNCLVVLNYNDYETTSSFIDRTKDFGSIDKIVVVDNNSNDGSYDKLYKYNSDKVHVIKSEKNGGYSYGNNIGIKYAMKKFKPEYIILSNPDVIFENEIIEPMIKFYEDNKSENIGIVSPTMIDKLGSNSAWKLPTLKHDLISSSTLLSRLCKDKCKYDKNDLNKEINFVDVISGCFFMIKADIIDKIDYLDEDIFLYCEERILAFKLKQIGYKNVVLGDISFIHEHSVSINKNITSKLKQQKIYCDSKLTYHRKYTKLSENKLKLLKCVFDITLLEKKILYSTIGKLVR